MKIRESSRLENAPEEWIRWKNSVASCREIPEAMIPSESKATAGICFYSFSISPSRYLNYLLSASSEEGMRCIVQEIDSLYELAFQD